MDIVEFIKARLGDEERVANAAAEAFLHGDRIGIDSYAMHPSVRMHVYSWTPARVLREVEAKRALLGQWQDVCDEVHQPNSVEHRTNARARQFQLEQVLAALALPYADHPDYRAEWRPTP